MIDKRVALAGLVAFCVVTGFLLGLAVGRCEVAYLLPAALVGVMAAGTAIVIRREDR